MNSSKKRALLAVVSCMGLALLAGGSAAQEEGAMGIKVGAGSRLLLSLGVAPRYSSNFYYQDDNEESTIGLIVAPSALLMTDRGELRHQVFASAEVAGFDIEGDADDYIDGLIGAKFDWQPLTRHYFGGGASWRADHDPFGTRRTESVALMNRSLDRWEEPAANVIYRFGAPNATLNLEAEFTTLEREYTTNRVTTRFLDYSADYLRGTAYYRISSKTQLLAEVITGDIDYDTVAPGFPSRAGELVRYRVGGRWLATGKTSGEIKLGRVERDFDSSVQPDYEEFDWQVAVNWEPRARDKLRFTTGREPEESYLNAASLIDNRYYRVDWEHDWTSRVKSRVTYGQENLEFQGIAREDDLQNWSFGLEYQAAPRWSLFGSVKLEERDSNVASRDYENTVISAGIRLNY